MTQSQRETMPTPVHIIPMILGEVIRGRTSGQSKKERTQEIIDNIMGNPYPVDWSIGSNEGVNRRTDSSSAGINRPKTMMGSSPPLWRWWIDDDETKA